MTLDIRTIEPSLLKAELLRLRDEEHMDFLENLIGMDWGEEGGLGVIYMLQSTTTGKRANLRCSTTDRVNPVLPTASDLWDIANIYEREVFDFYGIKFAGHPDMRRIFLREDWVGYPMRKDDKPEEENPFDPQHMTNEPLADTTSEYELLPDGTKGERNIHRRGLCCEHRSAAPFDTRCASLPCGIARRDNQARRPRVGIYTPRC